MRVPIARGVRTCPECGRRFPEVAGAGSQECPFCGHETPDAPRPAEPAEAPVPPDAEARPIADPVGALAHAGGFVSRRYLRLLALWVPVLVMDVVVTLALVAYQAAHPETEDLARLSVDQGLALLGVVLPLLLLDLAVTFAAWAWVARLVLGEGGHAGGEARAPPRVPLGASLAVGGILTVALAGGLVLLLLPGLILFHMFLFAPAALAGGEGVGGAFDASRRFSKERQTAGFTALVVLAAALLYAASFAIASFLARAAGTLGLPSPYVLGVLEVLPSWFLSPLLPVLPASYWLLARRAEEAPARDARPSGPARATTKCPRCATLVPYTPTGAPVDVKCPRCGAAGRVL